MTNGIKEYRRQQAKTRRLTQARHWSPLWLRRQLLGEAHLHPMAAMGSFPERTIADFSTRVA